ncbi:hypothetical protein ABPG75_009759 [Micractinium tetrahymenae]
MHQKRDLVPCRLVATLLTMHLAAGQLSPSSSTLRGRVVVLNKDLKVQLPCREVFLHNESDVPAVNATADAPRRSVFRLEGSYTAALRSGQRVAVSGYRIGALGGGAERVRLTGVDVLEEPAYGGSSGSDADSAGARRRLQQAGALPTLQLPLPTPEVSTLVLPISFAGCPSPQGGVYDTPWWTQQDVEAVIFGSGASNDSWASVSGLYGSCSHGQAALNRANSRVMPVIQLPCAGVSSYGTPYSSSTCDFLDFLGFQEAAADAARKAGVDTSAYLFQHVVLPIGTACDWVGLGYVGCDHYSFDCASWVQGDTLLGPTRGSETSAQAAFHEMGHNNFLDHTASFDPAGSVHVYGDTSGAMGYCCSDRCYNTAHSWQLGWLAPQVLDSSSLGPGDTRSVTFAAQSRSKYSGMQIDATTWLGGQNTTLYVSLRLPESGDSALGLPYTGHVNVHNFTSRDNFTPRLSYLLGTLGEGEGMAEDVSGLVISVTDISPQAGTATVVVCRKAPGGLETAATCQAGKDGDCDGLAGAADPDCSAFASRPPSPRPPPPAPPLRGTLLIPGPGPNPALTVPANAAKQCLLGHAFCTDVARAAAQAKPGTNFFTTSKAPLAGQCRNWLAKPTCAGSLAPCGCAPASTVQGSAVKPPASKQTALAKPPTPLRCALGHGSCAARARGSICLYWAPASGKQPTCTGSGLPCSCSSVSRVRLP